MAGRRENGCLSCCGNWWCLPTGFLGSGGRDPRGLGSSGSSDRGILPGGAGLSSVVLSFCA